MSRAVTLTDNTINESLNRWIKVEFMLDFDLYHSNNVEQMIKSYVHYFKHNRPVYSLNYKTPIQFKTELGFNERFLGLLFLG